MSLEDKRQAELSALHPAIRDRVKKIKAELNNLGFAFEIFEAYRSPQRQAYLYAQGRDRPGNIVTKAPPWTSYHQYGLAVDFVLKINGNWDWSSSGANAAAWTKLHEIGRNNGMEPLSWELPHLQMAGLSIAALHAGHFPDGGDESWATNLEAAIVSWTGSPAAPPPPKSIMRPAISGVDTETDTATRGGGQSNSQGIMMGSFEKVHVLIEKWEGGYTNDPRDPGGPTNRGITQADLAEWRGHPVSAEDVRNLTRDEALQIFKTKYWVPIKGDQLPLPAAQVVYNTCVLSGRGRAIPMLQDALSRQRPGIAVDGRMGSETIDACMAADQRRLVGDYCTLYETYLRSLPIFPTFGRGWLNRLSEIKSTAMKWAAGTDDTMTTRGSLQTATDSVAFGDHGPRVTALQETLKNAGYAVGGIDGDFGTLTRAAVLAFQADNNIPTTGVVDGATWAALDQAKPRPLSSDRVATTADDLREKGSETVKAADNTKIAALISSILGGLGIGNSAVVQVADKMATAPATPTIPSNLATFLGDIQQYLAAPTIPENLAKVDKLIESAKQLQNLNVKNLLSSENLMLVEQFRALIPPKLIDSNPAIATFLKQIDAVKPQIQTIFDVLPGMFANDSVLQTVSKGLALAAGSVIPGFGGSLAVLGIGLAANYFGNKIIKARVQDHATAGNTER